MTKLIVLIGTLVTSLNVSAFTCNEEQLKVISAGCSDSQTACAVRGINNILAGKSLAETILDMCSPKGTKLKPEDPLDLHDCTGKALKVSRDPKFQLIANRCHAKDTSPLHRLKVGFNFSEYEKCSRAELRKLIPQRGNTNGTSATR